MNPPLPPDTSPDAPWKQRFRAPLLGDLQIAPGDRRSAVVSGNPSGVFQTYAVDLTDGSMRQLTHADAGTVLSLLAQDGRSLLTLADEGGNEVGHWTRIALADGAITDLTPDLPAYSSWTVATDRAGAQVAIAITGDDGTQIWIASSTGEHAPRRLVAMWGLMLSLAFGADGSTLVCLTSEPTKSNAYALVAFDVATGERLGQLWDGPPSSMYGVLPEPPVAELRRRPTPVAGSGRCCGIRAPAIEGTLRSTSKATSRCSTGPTTAPSCCSRSPTAPRRRSFATTWRRAPAGWSSSAAARSARTPDTVPIVRSSRSGRARPSRTKSSRSRPAGFARWSVRTTRPPARRGGPSRSRPRTARTSRRGWACPTDWDPSPRSCRCTAAPRACPKMPTARGSPPGSITAMRSAR